MERFEYKYFSSQFFPHRVLQQVEAYEREGWAVYSLNQAYSYFLGCGGSGGLEAIMRRPVVRESATDDNV